jgi:hypothetical protein
LSLCADDTKGIDASRRINAFFNIILYKERTIR